MKENKKPFYTRWWFILFVILIAGGALSNIIIGDEEQTDVNEPIETEESEDVEETTSDPEEVEEESEQMISVDDELVFAEFTASFTDAMLFEEDGKKLIEISFNYLNQAGDGDKQFMNLAAMDVIQNDEILNDIDDSWNVSNRNTSPIYFPNAENGEYKIDLTYELMNSDPLEITIVPLVEGDESKSITIDLN